MEKTAQSNKDKNNTPRETKRKLKIQNEQCPSLKRSKVDEKGGTTKTAKGLTKRVTQPIYELAGQSSEDCLEEHPVFNKWVEENLPSQHQKSKGVYWISIERRHDNGLYETKSMSNIRAVQSAFEGTKIVNSKTLKKLAEKHSLTNGKWMFHGETGNEIDRLWRTVADGVIRGIIPTFSAKVSAAGKENENHVICIYNNNFQNEADVFALRDGIRNARIDNPLKYKANIYTHLGICRQNKWGIDPVLHRDESRQFESLYDSSYDKEASKSAVAGITLKRKDSPILSISGPREKCHYPITLGTKAISPILRHGKDHDDVRICIVFHDGNTIMRGVSFGDAARKFKRELQIGCTYKFRYYQIQDSKKEHSNTKYEITLRENTTIKTIEKGYNEIPKVKGKKISEINEIYKNLLVSTLKVRISKIGELFRPKKKFLREVFVKDETGEMKMLMWSYKKAQFLHSVGDHVILRYMTVKYDDQHCFLLKSDNTRIVRCQAK
ncbi:uncharacterized protein LOC127710823 [Mytilus californianus]|uniref:uncharacterized protein LOC127710823 n=1 Tax=Mytilus californianus TaxID=6549 RepID=UPI002246865D|nr:uncharacterized protein LOC127710823 [Mytilus californianus]